MKDPAAPPPRLRTRPVSPERLRQEATIAVLVARLVVRLLGPRAALVGRPCPRAATRRGRPTAGSIVEAAGRAARLWPRTSCLAEAIAARWLGQRYGHAMDVVVGATRAGEGLAAHAWVEQDGRALRPAAPGAHVRLGVLQRSETA
ncbi:MAG: lasso peptide biosynthesis B2 protein [Planctomycetes bacterium]|nr:lasso peptide biosynthesis B2 protein [Planctomycetota bacterium]